MAFFADALNVNGGHYLCLHARLGENVAHRKAVHGCCQHTHAVGADALDMSRAVLYAAPEVAAAYDDADLNAAVNAALYRAADSCHKVEVIAGVLVGGKRLTAYFYKNSAVFSHFSRSFFNV